VFELLGDVTLHATFPASELELARTRALSALALQLSQPGTVAQRFFGKEIYGRNPYGRSATRETYAAVTRDDVIKFAQQRLRPVGALLVVAGDVTDAQVRELAAKAFAGWRGAAPASPPLPAPATRVATDILLVHRPGSAQANIALGNTTILPTDPIYYPAASLLRFWAAGGLAPVPHPAGAEKLDVRRIRLPPSLTADWATGRRPRKSARTWRTAPCARLCTRSIGSGPRRFPTRSSRYEGIPRRHVPTHHRDAQPDRGPGVEREAARPGRRLPAAVPRPLGAVTALQARAAAARLYRRGALTIVVVGDA